MEPNANGLAKFWNTTELLVAPNVSVACVLFVGNADQLVAEFQLPLDPPSQA
jgi:hypothetical protein